LATGKKVKLDFDSSSIITGNALKVLKKIPPETIQVIVTSPPYWGMRDYDIKGQIGHETKLTTYISNLVKIFDEAKRALKANGTLWLNIGDCYTSGNRKYRAADKKNPARGMSSRPDTPKGLKSKDLIGVPWRLAFALQENGWYLRTEIIWHKPNGMPESVKDRPYRNHEYLFLFSKSEKYHFDPKALKLRSGKVKRSVWNIAVKNGASKHNATFPEELIIPCIKASSKKDDIVLDPFLGSGTVSKVSEQLSRKHIGIELNPKYTKIAVKRLANKVNTYVI
jgi:site-specific DNA-methyltransferase (cytosine-N4-specific)